MFLVNSIDLQDGLLKVKFTSNENIKDLKLVFRLKDSERFVLDVLKEEKQFLIEKESENTYYFNINIKDVLKSFKQFKNKREIIYLLIKVNNNYHKLNVNDNEKKVIKNKKFSYNNLANVRLNVLKNTLSLIIELKELKCKIDTIKVEKDKFSISIESYLNDSLININQLKIKKRKYKNVLKYSEIIELDKKNNLFELYFDRINLDKWEEQNNFDFVAEIIEDNIVLDCLIKIEKNIIKNIGKIPLKENLEFSFYSTIINTLSIIIRKKNNFIKLDSIKYVDKKLTIKFDEKQINLNNNLKLIISRVNNVNNGKEIDEFKEFKITNKESIELDIEEIFKNYTSNYKHIYTIYLRDDSNIYKLINKEINFDIKYENKIININCNNELILSMNFIQRNPVNLAVLGSCFSRAAFNSIDEYYNPDYKNFINVSYSHFWFSCIDNNGNKIEFDKNNFTDVREKDLLQITRSYYKNTIEEMSKTSVDYVFIDFFVDAIHGVRRYPDGSVIAPNVVLNKTEYYINRILPETENYDLRFEDYLDNWKFACDKLIEQLSKIIDLNRVIINYSNLTNKYIDENNEIKSFILDKGFNNTQLNYYNLIWNRMNNYFLTKVPQAKVVDMIKYNYISSYNHPISCGPHHFQSEYYKKLMDEIIKVILFNELSLK